MTITKTEKNTFNYFLEKRIKISPREICSILKENNLFFTEEDINLLIEEFQTIIPNVYYKKDNKKFLICVILKNIVKLVRRGVL